jgi:hypothetical protein
MRFHLHIGIGMQSIWYDGNQRTCLYTWFMVQKSLNSFLCKYNLHAARIFRCAYICF